MCVTGLTLLTTGLFFGYARQWLLLLPFWFAVIAASVVSLTAWGHDLVAGNKLCLQMVCLPLTRSIMTAFVVLALVLLVAEGLGSRADRNYTASGTTLPGSRQLNPDLPVRIKVLAHPS